MSVLSLVNTTLGGASLGYVAGVCTPGVIRKIRAKFFAAANAVKADVSKVEQKASDVKKVL